MRQRNTAYIALVILSLAAVLFFIFTDSDTVSELENRSLADFPRFSFSAFLTGEFQDQLEDALGDHMPFSEEIRSTVRTAEIEILRFQQDAIYHVFPEPSNNYTQIAEGYYSYASDPHRIVEKPAQSPSLPAGLRTFAQKTESLTSVRRMVYWIDNSRSISFDDPADVSAKKEEVLALFPGAVKASFTFGGYSEFCEYFYQTDHHWNHRGSYRGYTEILSLIRPEEQSVPIAE